MSLGPWEIGIIVLLIIVLFGAKKLPDAARSIGRSMRIFKSEVKEMNKDGDTPEQQQQPQQQIAPNQIELLSQTLSSTTRDSRFSSLRTLRPLTTVRTTRIQTAPLKVGQFASKK